MNAQTVGQLKLAAPPNESFWHFVAGLPATMEAQILYALMAGALVGALVNFLTQWAKGEIQYGLLAYIFYDNPKRTLLSAIVLFGALVGELMSVVFVNSGVFVGYGLVALSGFKSGYVIDNLVNKASRVEWTDEQRAKIAPP